MKKVLVFFVCLLLIQVRVMAQDIQVQPSPRQVNVTGKSMAIPVAFRLVGEQEANPHAITLLKQSLGDRLGTEGFPLYVGEKGGRGVRGVKRLIPDHPEGYYLSITDKAIMLAGNDERGTYYAVRTFMQLFHEGHLPFVEIQDYPDVRFRGVVEGFYGTPWSHEARLRQLRFYGENKLNTYIYGPKDDPYHSSPNWRKPYPVKEAARLAELVKVANENEVDFVWAIHPGLDIRWETSDRDSLMAKFEHMYDLGVRSFAVFFDDISGEGAKADRQVELLNYIDDHFVQVKPDVTPLIVCPTEYNKGWARPESGYLATIGEKLNPSVEVMWTGDRVISEITKEGVEWIREQIKRPSYIWWNFPVSDYVRDHLLLGEVYGNGKDIAGSISGFVANPMEWAEASKLAIYCVADYTWNMQSYDRFRSWHRAIRAIMPENVEAFTVFARHNSDLGENVHRFRREESVEIQPVAERFMKGYREGHCDERDFLALQDEFERVAEAADLLLIDRENEALIEEITPWLHQFKILGDVGQEALAMIKAGERGDRELFLRKYNHVKALRKRSYELERQFNQNPYQPGVKTGTTVLQPLVLDVFTEATERFNRQNGTDLPLLADYSPCKLTTNVPQLESLPLQVYPNRVHLTPLLEVVKWPVGGYLQLEFADAYRIPGTRLNFDVKGDLSWGVMEVSADGETWQTVALTRDTRGRLNGKWEDAPVKFVRFTNTGEGEQQVYLREFYVVFSL